jgi:ribosomal-protein-alanine N-acetyltransferase
MNLSTFTAGLKPRPFKVFPMPSSFDLRPYTATDLDAMVALDDVCFAEPFRFNRASMKSFAEAKNACTLLAEEDGQLAGFCILHVETSRRRLVGYVVTLDVAPAHRRRGLATELMQGVERMAVAEECSAMLLHVYAENAGAVAFYQRLGFERLYDDEGFYGEGLDAVVMHRRLGAS